MTHKLTRRGLVSGLLGIGATGMLTAGGLHPDLRKRTLDTVSRWNDRVQSNLFSQTRLAPTYSEAQITRPFRYNGFYPEAYAPRIDPETWRLTVDGLVPQATALDLPSLRAMAQESQITRLICIEGWSAIGQWSGVPLADVLRGQKADLGAKYVRFDCADGYHSSIDMASALHPQTILALDFLDRPLPQALGAPLRLRIPTKLGFKNAKFLTRVTVTNEFPGGYWEDQGYNWFAGL